MKLFYLTFQACPNSIAPGQIIGRRNEGHHIKCIQCCDGRLCNGNLSCSSNGNHRKLINTNQIKKYIWIVGDWEIRKYWQLGRTINTVIKTHTYNNNIDLTKTYIRVFRISKQSASCRHPATMLKSNVIWRRNVI